MKKGVTMSVVLIAIVVMMMLISSATVIGTASIRTAKYEEFRSSVQRVADNINEYYIKNKSLPVRNEVIASNSLEETFQLELDKKGDLNEKLFVVDMSKIGDASIEIGRGTISSGDVFLVSEESQNVYYLKGHRYKNVVYYGVS